MHHDLKTWPRFWPALRDGRKTWEVRRDDRGFYVGDTLRLREWSPTTKRYTGSEMEFLVTYLTELPCMEGFVGMTIRRKARGEE